MVKRADERQLLEPLRDLRHERADIHTGSLRLAHTERTAELGRGVRLRVERFELTRPAVEPDEDDRLVVSGAAGALLLRQSLRAEQVRQRQTRHTEEPGLPGITRRVYGWKRLTYGMLRTREILADVSQEGPPLAYIARGENAPSKVVRDRAGRSAAGRVSSIPFAPEPPGTASENCGATPRVVRNAEQLRLGRGLGSEQVRPRDGRADRRKVAPAVPCERENPLTIPSRVRPRQRVIFTYIPTAEARTRHRFRRLPFVHSRSAPIGLVLLPAGRSRPCGRRTKVEFPNVRSPQQRARRAGDAPTRPRVPPDAAKPAAQRPGTRSSSSRFNWPKGCYLGEPLEPPRALESERRLARSSGSVKAATPAIPGAQLELTAIWSIRPVDPPRNRRNHTTRVMKPVPRPSARRDQRAGWSCARSGKTVLLSPHRCSTTRTRT